MQPYLMVSRMIEFKQLDIYWVDLEPTKGAETQKLRPCVIIQSDVVNIQSKTLIVAPMLPNHKSWPFAVNLTPTTNNGLDKDRHINLKQLRAVDISRIGNKQGKLENEYRSMIKRALAIIFDL
ncbi:mRNA interferase MazF [Nitrosomonas sp. Nm84]|uniref:type II toxin-antitoxin system PemK/MazF family toxin n=1 Tax=Nitrosomonas sp. Nm84 TaxID=200124 RepID=UPI000D89D032|nr:type II toxin-antitoxin system PemK/MazF family toxin [Nitrosomonas sp. Nm84]PXW80384.1 mRNA interferase MazF [Nitrosomonas sp. Nm84]